jgi:hypothetical protein
MKYKVKRAFYLGAKVQAEGSIVELTDRDLIGSLKSFDKIEADTGVIEENPGPISGGKVKE